MLDVYIYLVDEYVDVDYCKRHKSTFFIDVDSDFEVDFNVDFGKIDIEIGIEIDKIEKNEKRKHSTLPLFHIENLMWKMPLIWRQEFTFYNSLILTKK